MLGRAPRKLLQNSWLRADMNFGPGLKPGGEYPNGHRTVAWLTVTRWQ